MRKKQFVLGGDLNKSLTEGYQLNFKSLFKDASIITRKHYFPAVTASLFTFVLLGYVQFKLLPAADLTDLQKMMAYYLVALFAAPPFLTGLQMMGIHHSIGLKTRSVDLFNYFRIILKLALAALIISLISNVISLALTQVMGKYNFKCSKLSKSSGLKNEATIRIPSCP